MAKAASGRMSFRNLNARSKKEEEEERVVPQAPKPEEPQPASQTEAPEQADNVTIEKTGGGVKASIGPTNRRDDPGMFDLMASKAYKAADTTLVKSGELDQLPVELQDDAQALEKKNAQNGYTPQMTGRWSSEGNEVKVDYGSIKNDTHAMYFAANLADDKQRYEFFEEYATEKGLDLEGLLYSAEQTFGSKLFDNPQSNKGKMSAAGMYDLDGGELDMSTTNAAVALRSLRMVPDSNPYKKAAKKAYIAEFGYLPDEDFDFMDSADLTETDYKNQAKEFAEAFSISDGETEENTTRYLEMLDQIELDYADKPSWVYKQIKAELDRTYAQRTGVLPPDENALRARAEEAEAQTDSGDEENSGWFSRLADKVGDLFSGTGKVKKPEEENEEETEAPKLEASRPTYYANAVTSAGGHNSAASSYAAAGSAPIVSAAQTEPIRTQAEPEETKEEATPEATPETTAQIQGPDDRPEAQTAQEEAPYIAEMTDEQALAQYLSGQRLNAKNYDQIKWATENPETLGILNFSAPGFAMPETMNNTEAKMHRTFSVYGHYGSGIGSAAMAINSGEVPGGMKNVASLELMQIVSEIGEAVANPANGISIPSGKNMYDYFLTLPQGEAYKARIQGVTDSLKATNDVHASFSLDEAQAQKKQIERDKAMVLAGIGGDPAMDRLAQSNPSTAQIESDPTRSAWRKQMSDDSDFYSDDGAFWHNGSAAAQEGLNILAASGGREDGYVQYKGMLREETNTVLDECTSMALQCGISLEEYFRSVGIESVDQVVDIAYCRMLEKGNAYADDGEAQEAAAVLAQTDDTHAIGWSGAALAGGEHGLVSTAANFMNTAYMVVDDKTYEQSRSAITDQYYAQYGPEMAAVMYRSDLTAYAQSGQMSQRAAEDLMLHMNQARSIFDVAYEIEPGFLESLTRNSAERLQKRTEELEAVAAKLPEGERSLFSFASSATGSIAGMGVAAGVGILTGSPLIGSAAAFGMPTYSEAYYQNRWYGMSPGMSKRVALGNAGISVLLNWGGNGSQMDTILGDAAYTGMKKALTSEGVIGWVKAMGKQVAKHGIEEGTEELGELMAETTYDLLDKEFLALDSGAAPSLSRTYRNMMDSLYEIDPVELAKEAAYSFGTGALFGAVFSAAGVAKTGLTARRAAKAEQEYKSIGLASQMTDGTIPVSDQTMGDFFVALRDDLQNPEYCRWIDSRNAAALDQKAAVAAMMMGEGEEHRSTAAAEAKKAEGYKSDAKAAAQASTAAQSEYAEARERLMAGDLEADVEAEGALDRWGKAETARQEAESAAAKAEQNATEAMRLWLKECRIAAPQIKADMLNARMSRIAQARLEEAQRLAAQYEAEEAARAAEEARYEASAAEGAEYAESRVFEEEEWAEDEANTEEAYADLEGALNYAEAITQQKEFGETTEDDEEALTSIREYSLRRMLDLMTRAKAALDDQGNITAYNELVREYNKLRNRVSNIYELGKLTPVMKEKAEPDFVPPEIPELSERALELKKRAEKREAARLAEIEMAESHVFREEADAEPEEAVAADADEGEDIEALSREIEESEGRIANVLANAESVGMTEEAASEYAESERAPIRERKNRIIAREKARFNNAFERMQAALEMDDDDAADQIAAEYDRIGERLSSLGVNTDALIFQQYGYDVSEVNEAAEAAQAQEAERTETEKHERLTKTLERQMAETAMKREQNTPARQYLMARPIYVNEYQAADILAAEGLKSIAQVNRRYHTKLTTDEKANTMPLDGHVMNDINREAAGSVDESADPVSELLRVMQTGKALAAEQKQQQAQAKELQAKRKAADKRRRESVDALTGRDAEPVRQAKAINSLVANKNSTVEQIDNAVDRIEGVSMSMNNGGTAIEPEQTTLFDEEAGTVNSMFKDPVMQKLASDLYKNWGIRLRTADLDPRDEGFYDRESNTIVLNKRLTSGEKQRTVIMHELIHFCEEQAWYPQFKKDILTGAYSGEAEIEENRERLRDMGYAEKDLDFELVAHAAKPLFEGDEVLVGNLLEKGKTSAVKRAYAAISQYIARRKAKKMGMGKQYDALLSARKTLAKGLKNAKTAGGSGVRHALNSSAQPWYDYSKSFAEQIDDYLSGNIPKGDALVLGGTPQIYQNVGLSNLPLTINTGHINDAVDGTRDTEHTLGKSLLSQMPELLADPIAIIESQGTDGADKSLVSIVKAIINGKPVIAPVYIGGESKQNGIRIDTNAISTAFRKNNAVAKLLSDAINKENANGVGVYYINKTEAQNLYAGAGVQFPGSNLQDGLNHSIFDAGSPVNKKYLEQTQTKQFKRWFDRSQIKNADGTPKIMYRGGNEDIEIFDRKKSSYSNLYGRGFYFTESREQAGVYGETHPYYLSVKHPLSATSNAKAIKESQLRAFLEEVAENEDYGLENYGYGATVNSVLKSLKGKSDFDVLQDINATCIGDFVVAVELFNEVNGTHYDGIITPTETVVFDSRQIKSADKNIGLFDPQNPNVRYSRDTALSQYGNQTAQEIDWINQAVKEQLKGSTHEVQTDRAAIVETLSRIEELGGVQEALRDLMSRPVDRWNAQDQAMAQVLMAKAEYDGDVTTEAVVAMMYDKSGSEAGLALQKRKLLARMDSQNALALVSRLASDFNMKSGGSSQYAPVGNGRPLEKIDGAAGDANGIIDRAKRVNDAIVAERGMDDIIERKNRWGVPVTGAQMYLIEEYGLSHTDLPGAHYSRATVKQRMLAAILATDTDVVYDMDVDGNRNGLLGLIQQLEAMKAGKAVQTIADLTYISNQMAEMKAQSNGSEDPYLNTQEAKIALARAYDAINNVVPVTMGQRGGALAYMNMLSASTTGVKNVLGNVVMGPMEAASETIAAAIDKAVSAKTKNRTTAVSTAQETADGLKEGLAELANTFADTYIYQTDTSYGRKYEMSGDAPRVYQNNLAEAKRRMVDFIMQLGDRPFFKAEYARQMDMIHRLCKESKMKKKDVVSTPDGRQIVSYVEMTEADMHAEAAQRALERVFQEDNAIVNWVNSAPAALRPFMQAVVPFVKTPTNIAKRMLDYSPIGLAKTIAVNGYHAARKDGGFDQRKFVMGIGRGLTGTGMIMAGALLSSLGILDIEDGYGEEDDGKLYGAGMANYDPYGKYINIDGNKTSLDWLGAAGIWMTIGAAAAKEWGEDTGLGEAMYSTMLKSGPEILNLLFDNTMLSSVSELLGGAEDGEELGTNIVETIVGSALQQYFSPADIRQFAKFTDEYERDYRNDNPVIEAINKNVIRYWPVLRQTLPIKYDITGDAVRQSSKYGWGRQDEDVVLNFLNMYMSPTNIQSDKGDEALTEVIDLAYRLGDTSCIPSNLITTNGNITIPVTMAKKTTLGAGENKLTLSVDEQRKYNQMYASLCFNGTEKGRKYEKVGSGAYGNVQGIRDLIESREYQRADNQGKSDMIEDIMKQAKEIVRAQICIDRGYEK